MGDENRDSGTSSDGGSGAGDHLRPRDRRRAGRLQFAPLPPGWDDRVDGVLTNGQQYAIDTPHVRATHKEIERVLITGDVQGRDRAWVAEHIVRENVVDTYMRLICRSRNDHHANRPPSCVVLEPSFLREYPEDQDNDGCSIDDRLRDLGCLQDMFKLEYLFLPIYRDWGELRGQDNNTHTHHFLMGIAPQQECAFIIDTCEYSYVDTEWPRSDLRDIMLRYYWPEIQESGAELWPIYAQFADLDPWDESPPGPRQGDRHNCGVFMVSIAMCLAFGYDIKCIRQRYLDYGKRRRMVAELMNDGFNPPFDYQHLPHPRDLIGVGLENLDRTETDEYGDSYLPTDESEGVASDMDLDEGASDPRRSARIHARLKKFAESDIKRLLKEEAPAEPKRKRVKRGEPKDTPATPIAPTAGPAPKTIPIILEVDTTKPPTTPQSDNNTWNPVFPRHAFRKIGFIYRSDYLRFANVKGKPALIEECKKWQFKKYERWAKGDEEIFRRWMENSVMERLDRGSPGSKVTAEPATLAVSKK